MTLWKSFLQPGKFRGWESLWCHSLFCCASFAWLERERLGSRGSRKPSGICQWPTRICWYLRLYAIRSQQSAFFFYIGTKRGLWKCSMQHSAARYQTIQQILRSRNEREVQIHIFCYSHCPGWSFGIPPTLFWPWCREGRGQFTNHSLRRRCHQAEKSSPLIDADFAIFTSQTKVCLVHCSERGQYILWRNQTSLNYIATTFRDHI